MVLDDTSSPLRVSVVVRHHSQVPGLDPLTSRTVRLAFPLPEGDLCEVVQVRLGPLRGPVGAREGYCSVTES